MNKFAEFFDVPEVSIDDAKQRFIDNMDMLKSMPVQEQTLYKKWKEIKGYYANKVDASRVVKAKIWTPTDIMNKEQTVAEINALQPRIRYVVPKTQDESDWLMLRVFSHTMEFDQNPGRFVRFLAYDEITGKYLGAVSLGSDVISITCRDEWIGWDKDTKLGGKLNNSAIGTCIMATQPFGYNFLGGKLVASLLTTKVVAETWEKLYNNKLVGLTTTSLYGGHSMYQRIPFWKEMGLSKGAITIKPDDDVYDEWHQWIKENMADEYDKKILSKDTGNGPVTGIKQHILSIIFKAVGISQAKYRHGFERGVYYAPLYENTREFLKGDITEKELVPLKKLEKDVDAVVDWWKVKAIARYCNLYEQGRIKPEILYYNNIIDMSWDEAKQAYLGDVGR
jgi:hypothetical protein